MACEMQEERLVELWLSSRSLENARALRNAVVQSDAARAQVVSEAGDVVTAVAAAVQEATRSPDPAPDEDRLLLGRCALQLLHNICSVAPELHLEVLARAEKLLLDCLLFPDAKIRNFSASVFLRLIEKESNPLSAAVVAPLIEALRDDSEFALLCIKKLIKDRPGLISLAYDDLEAEGRLFLLDAVAELKEDGKVPKILADKFASVFKVEADVLFRGRETSSSDMTKLAGLLSELAGSDSDLQRDKSLLISAVHLLKMIHESAKSVAAPSSNGQQQSQAVAGFKRSLVRLIGNLCWKNKANQDTVRELDGIPLVLDCSAIDEQNPFITEWVVFAIRGLCEGNEENQNIIRGIDKAGRVLNLS